MRVPSFLPPLALCWFSHTVQLLEMVGSAYHIKIPLLEILGQGGSVSLTEPLGNVVNYWK